MWRGRPAWRTRLRRAHAGYGLEHAAAGLFLVPIHIQERALEIRGQSQTKESEIVEFCDGQRSERHFASPAACVIAVWQIRPEFSQKAHLYRFGAMRTYRGCSRRPVAYDHEFHGIPPSLARWAASLDQTPFATMQNRDPCDCLDVTSRRCPRIPTACRTM